MSMEYVILKNNKNAKYTIHEFNKMTEVVRNSFKGRICCPKCNGDAGYRKASTDGKVACFFAKHVDGCGWLTNNKSNKTEGIEDTNIIEVDTSAFGVRWNYRTKKADEGNSIAGTSGNNSTINNKNYVNNPAKKTQAKLTLNQILTYAEIDKLNDVEIDISIGGKTKRISELVFNTGEIDNSFIDERAFYWGEMKAYNKNFINLRNTNEVSIFIIKEIMQSFDDRYKNKFFKVLKSNLIIVFGKVIKARNGKFLIVLDDMNKIYFREK